MYEKTYKRIYEWKKILPGVARASCLVVKDSVSYYMHFV